MKLRYNFEVTAECAWGYEGTPVATVCSGPNQPYSIDTWHDWYMHNMMMGVRENGSNVLQLCLFVRSVFLCFYLLH